MFVLLCSFSNQGSLAPPWPHPEPPGHQVAGLQTWPLPQEHGDPEDPQLLPAQPAAASDKKKKKGTTREKGRATKLRPGSAPPLSGSPQEGTLCPGDTSQALLPGPVGTNGCWSTAFTDDPNLTTCRTGFNTLVPKRALSSRKVSHQFQQGGHRKKEWSLKNS